MTDTAAELGRFLAQLADHHPDEKAVFAMRLAETGLDALARGRASVPVVAVIGPTQTGKSTVVNVLAGGQYVETSPLAAFTRQASALAVNVGTAECFLSREREIEPIIVKSDCPACVIWDTPDFDSNASAAYRQEVGRVCALADLIVVVVSKEKYADRSVWEVLETIAPLGTPVVICLNKCEGRSETEVLVPIIRRRLEQESVTSSGTPVMTLPLVPDGDLASLLQEPDAKTFRHEVFDGLERLSRSERKSALQRFINANWDEWTAPVERELECVAEWEALLASHTKSFMRRYRSEYIDHTRHHDIAQKAILGLLELLEIPALAGPLARTRRALTWPFRKLTGVFGNPGDPGKQKDQELEVLDSAFRHCMLSLRSEVSNRTHPWWRTLARELKASEVELSGDFHRAIEQYRQAFQPRIERLSEELYEQLKQSPMTLNALRAARVSADAGGIVLAIKTGTLGLYDALFAPAVISLTSYVTESAVGQYMKVVIGNLKREQAHQVDVIVRESVDRPLRELRLHGPGLFGVSRRELEDAARRIEELHQ